MRNNDERCAGHESGDVDYSVRTDPELLAQGWVRRYLADPKRAREAVELYSSLGYEVLEHKLTPEDFGPMCGECPTTVCRTYVLIYTRRLKPDTAT